MIPTPRRNSLSLAIFLQQFNPMTADNLANLCDPYPIAVLWNLRREPRRNREQ